LTAEKNAINSLGQTIATVKIDPRPNVSPDKSVNGYNTLAQAHPDSNPPFVTLYKGFYQLEFMNQSAQTLVHEVVHIGTGLTDQQLAFGATGKRYGPNQQDQASLDFHAQLTSKCY
jgi:hypothetical protein